MSRNDIYHIARSVIKAISVLLLFACLIIGLYLLVKYLLPKEWLSSVGVYGNTGDFFAGTIGVLLTFLSFLLMLKTFKLQREQFDRQMEQNRQASFETTYFNLLSSLTDVRKDALAFFAKTKDAEKNNVHPFSFADWHESLKDAFKSKEVSVPDDATDSQVEAEEGEVAEIYEEFVDANGYTGFYFRFIHNTIKFVINYWEEYETIRKYTDLLCAKLSDEELAILFYNAISKYGRDQNEDLHFKKELDFYQFFENLNKDYLIDRSHFRFYPHTDFKFLYRDERDRYLLKNKVL